MPEPTDKEKLLYFANKINALETPVVESPEAKDLLIYVMQLLTSAAWKLEGFAE